MKQTSLMDSFIRKQRQTNQQKQPQNDLKLKQTNVAEKIEPEAHTPNHKARPIFVERNEDNQEQDMNSFKQLINNGVYSFEKIVIDSRKKRKMDIEDDPDPKTFARQKQRELVQQEANSSNQDEKEKDVRQSGRMFGSRAKSANKKAQEEKFKKSTTLTARYEASNNNEQPPQEFIEVTPDWATPQGCRDARGRRPNHPDYDPTTLMIPAEAVKGLTQTMKQYWRIKSQNFDKLILFKLGKFYQMFYEDALVGNKHLDLKWMGNKMHVGFPEKCLEKYAHQFVQLGYKLVVVEQLQTPEQMKERMNKQRSQGKKVQKTLQRGVTQLITKGTTVSFIDQNQYLPNYLIAVSKHNNLIAYSLLEMGTNLIVVGLSESIQDFKTVLFQTRPVQLLYDPDNLPIEIVELMKVSWLNMVLSKLSNKDNSWHPMNARTQIENKVNEGVFPMPAIFQAIEKMTSQNEKLILATLSGMFKYLKSLLKFDYIMSAVRFSFYQQEGSALTMVLDSQALQHLQIFQTPLGEKDSLFQKIDRTTTKFGRRLFRRWLMQPLLDPYKINQRLDAVEDLQNIRIDRERMADILKRLPDLERIVNRLYHYSVKAIAEKAVYFEDVSSSRLREFRELIEHFNKSWYGLELLRKHKHQFKSKRLVQLLTLAKRQNMNGEEEADDKQIGLLPSVRQNIAQFDEYIKWQGDIPRPQKGLVQSYDMLQDELAAVKVKLQQYLQQVRQMTGLPVLRYVHTKERYEIEIPEELQKKRLPDMMFTSKRQGYSRYITPQSKRLVADIEYVQQQIKEQMGLFVGYFFEEFRKNQKIWEQYVEILAEIDCLIAISTYSMQSQGVRPQFVEQGFQIQEAKHPCLNITDVIANNISLNSKIMLLTGPNMGGKSTLLRTACLMVILAQTGCYVPADSYRCEIIDRIFTRIGASDKLEEGKSTFFIEMEQTKSIINYGTHKSLAIIDELGRGTSTFDGMAIAYSVLLDLIERVQCRCLFATHYHSLSKQFEGISAVKLKMMDFMVSDERIIFLYKLKDGRAEQSFGLNVAKVVKIPQQILQLARFQSKKMEQQISRKDTNKKIKDAVTLAMQ